LEDYALTLSHKTFYDLMLLLVEKPLLAISEWEAHAPLSLLNQAPFKLCTVLEDEFIIFNQDKCAELTSDDLYEWHYEVVKAIQTRLTNV